MTTEPIAKETTAEHVTTTEPLGEPEQAAEEPVVETVPEPEVPAAKTEPEKPAPEPEVKAETTEPTAEPNPLAGVYRDLLMEFHNVPEGLKALLPKDPHELKDYLMSEGYKELAKNLTPAPEPPVTKQPELPDRTERPQGPNLKNVGLAFNGVL